MHQEIQITHDMYWVGGNDRRLALFESVYPIPNGVSYNSYLVLDEKTILFDTVDKAVSGVFFDNLEYLLSGRKLDFVVVNHMEPDHAATLEELVRRYPDVLVVCNAKTVAMIKQFFTFDIEGRKHVVKEGDVLCTGSHTFTFVMAPMVHWPEVMVSYDTTEKILYSADAFGTFGAIAGNIFADKAEIDMSEYRRYYTNIVGKYGTQVQTLLKKAAGLEIAMICPLHGLIWRSGISDILEKYIKWSGYEPEEDGVLVAYSSVYGDTQNAAEIVANRLAERGVSNITMYDVSVTHPSYVVSEAFRLSHIVLATTTYNAGIFVSMENLLHDLKAHNLQNRTIAIVENGTWASTAAGLIKNILSTMKNITVLEENTVTLKSSVKQDTRDGLIALADAVYDSMPKPAVRALDKTVDTNAFNNISYGLFVLSSKDEKGDNACIVNTVMQQTTAPNRISVTVNKSNYTHDLIAKSGVFNVSVISTAADFELFKTFGFASGKDTDKFENFKDVQRSSNGLLYITAGTNTFISAKVVASNDLGTHTQFIAEVTEAAVISPLPSATYVYYHEHIKPKPHAAMKNVSGWVCRICGYVYEGDTLPDDIVCPLCKHGASDFEPIG